MPAFMNGPMGGTATFDPSVDEMGQPDPSMQQGDEEDEATKLDNLLQAALGLAQADTLSEQNRLKIQKVMTLIQEIKASEEKDVQAGKMTPGLLQKAYGGQSAA